MADPPKKKGLTLYEDLLTPKARAERDAEEAKARAEEEKKKKKDASSLMFKPMNLNKKNTRPPQKPKPTFASMPASSNTSYGSAPGASSSPGAPSAQPPIGPRSVQQQQPPTGPRDQQQPPQKRTFQDWLPKEDEEQHYHQQHRYPSKKVKKNQHAQQRQWSFDDSYHPGNAVPWGQYHSSEDHQDMNAGWNRRLVGARAQHQGQSSTHGNHPLMGSRQAPNMQYPPNVPFQQPGMPFAQPGMPYPQSNMPFPPPGMQFPPTNMQFPPPNMQSQPPGMSFQPPQNYAPRSDHGSDPVSRSGSLAPSSGRNSGFGNRYEDEAPASFAPPVEINKDESGDDVYARRMRMGAPHPHPTASSPVAHAPPPPPPANAPPTANIPPARAPLSAEDAEKRAKAAAQIAAIKARQAAKKAGSGTEVQDPPPPPTSSPPPPPPAGSRPTSSGGVIAAAPTFNPEYFAYKARQEAAKGEKLSSDEEAAANLHARQSISKGKRMMLDMGYEEGKGLGASGEGITTALKVQPEKRKKKPDAQGGGFVTPSAMGKIVGGKKTSKTDDDDEGGPHGKMSAVVKFEGMLKGMDVDKAIQDEGILQEIGDEMAEFGKVERLKIWRDHEGGNDEVFIKFTSQLSALRAIKAMDGAEFEGNTIQARYWDDEKFETGQYA